MLELLHEKRPLWPWPHDGHLAAEDVPELRQLVEIEASKPAAGAAVGLVPMPAPSWLHQLPLWMRRSIRDAMTNVRRSVDVLAAVGRFEPPQPLREVSISMPILVG